MSEFSRSPVVALLSAVSANGAGPVIDLGVPQDTLTLEVETSGTVSAFSVQLAASLDGSHWENLGSAVTAATAGTSVGTGVLFQYFQATLSGYTGTGTVTCELAYSSLGASGGGGGPPGALADDSDTDISSPALGQALVWNGSRWANVAGLESSHAIGSPGGSHALDVTAGAVQTVTLTTDITYTWATAPGSGAWSFTLIQSQNGTGGWTVAWPSAPAPRWQDGIAPALTSNPDATDMIVFATPDGGSTWYGSLAGANFF